LFSPFIAYSLVVGGELLAQVDPRRVAPEARHDVPQVGFGLLVALGGGGGPQRFDGGTLRGQAGHSAAIHLEAGPRQQLVLEVDLDVLFGALVRDGLHLEDLEVLKDSNDFTQGLSERVRDKEEKRG
jgi:hypothetical protein